MNNEKKYIIDSETMKKIEEAKKERHDKGYQNFIDGINEEQEKMSIFIDETFKAYEEYRNKTDKAKMEEEIEQTKKEAEDRIKEKYKTETGRRREWNESDLDKAFRKFAQEVDKNTFKD